MFSIEGKNLKVSGNLIKVFTFILPSHISQVASYFLTPIPYIAIRKLAHFQVRIASYLIVKQEIV